MWLPCEKAIEQGPEGAGWLGTGWWPEGLEGRTWSSWVASGRAETGWWRDCTACRVTCHCPPSPAGLSSKPPGSSVPPQGLPACVSISRSLCQHRVKEAVLFFWEPSGDLFHPTQASVKWGWLSGTPEDQRGNKDSEMRGRGGGGGRGCLSCLLF